MNPSRLGTNPMNPRRPRSLLIGMLLCAGCAAEPDSTDPQKLPPLNAEQVRAIQAEDQRIQQEEGGLHLGNSRPLV
jgi:uncharacterized lipoprotein YajG